LGLRGGARTGAKGVMKIRGDSYSKQNDSGTDELLRIGKILVEQKVGNWGGAEKLRRDSLPKGSDDAILLGHWSTYRGVRGERG